MKHKTKRLLSWLLALAMVFALVPQMSFSASAEMGDVIGDDESLTFTAVDGPASVTLNYNTGTVKCQEQDGDGNWKDWAPYTKGKIELNDGQSVRFRGTSTTFNMSNHVSIVGKVACSGNVMSLRLDAEGREQGLAAGCFMAMFTDCTGLTTAPELPATTLAPQCYYGMFYGCGNLTTAPELPATTLADYCYAAMFRECGNLTTAPVLPARELAQACYYGMFADCTSLNAVTCLATDISANRATTNWLAGITSPGTFTKAKGMTGWETGANGIPVGWTTVVPVENVTLDQESLSLTVDGEAKMLTATVLPNGDETAEQKVEWGTGVDSSGEDDNAGEVKLYKDADCTEGNEVEQDTATDTLIVYVKGISEGDVTVIATAGGKNAYCDVTVGEAAQEASADLREAIVRFFTPLDPEFVQSLIDGSSTGEYSPRGSVSATYNGENADIAYSKTSDNSADITVSHGGNKLKFSVSIETDVETGGGIPVVGQQVTYTGDEPTAFSLTVVDANGSVRTSVYPAPTTYTINYDGSITDTTVSDDVDSEAEEGAVVNLTVNPDPGTELDTLTIKDANDAEVQYQEVNGKYQFTMPASNVTITATYKESTPPSTYTLTIPSTLTVANSGWNATDGISATGSLADGNKLTVTATSEDEFALVNQDNDTQKVGYQLATASTDTEATTSWTFDSLSDTATTKPMGIIVEDYSDKPAGTYQDTVIFTAKVENAAPATITVTWNNDDITGSGNSFTKDDVTITAGSIGFDEKTFEGNGTFTTTLGNFTKIEVVVTNGFCDVSGPGWSGDPEKMTWTGNASSVSFSGDIYGDGNGISFVFTIESTN